MATNSSASLISLFDGRELRRLIFFALALVACVWPLTAEAARVDAIWKVQLEGPPLDKNGNEIDPFITTAKLLGAGRLVDLHDDTDDIIGRAKGAAALRLEHVIEGVQKINLQAFGGNGLYVKNTGVEKVVIDVKVIKGVKNCKKGKVGSLILVERRTRVGQARLILCDMDFYWTNRKDQTVDVSIKKDPKISGTWDFTDDPAGNMTITRKGTTNEYTGKYRGTGAHSQLRGTLIGTVGPDYWSGNFSITELGNVVAGTFKCKILIPIWTVRPTTMACQFSGGSLAKFTLKEIK
jgi:hypothetical protein